jgi:hypothetical protein
MPQLNNNGLITYRFSLLLISIFLLSAVIGLEFAGAIIFATFIAFITSVVTSIDVNSRKIAEELDAVASFVQV